MEMDFIDEYENSAGKKLKTNKQQKTYNSNPKRP